MENMVSLDGVCVCVRYYIVTCVWAATLQEVSFIHISNHTFTMSNRWPSVVVSILSFL